jgi:hypothetical protein
VGESRAGLLVRHEGNEQSGAPRHERESRVAMASKLGGPAYGTRQEAPYGEKITICWFPRYPSGVAKYFRILRSEMADLIFVVLTIAIFVIFGFVVKAVERL